MTNKLLSSLVGKLVSLQVVKKRRVFKHDVGAAIYLRPLEPVNSNNRLSVSLPLRIL